MITNMKLKIYFLFTACLFIFSCNNKDIQEIKPENYKGLTFKVSGFTEDVNAEESFLPKASLPNQLQTSKKHIADGFEIETDIIEEKKFEKNIKNSNKIGSTKPLSTSSKYWLILYKSSNREIVFNDQVTADAALTLPEVSNTFDYKWIAFTYNDAADIVFNKTMTHVPANNSLTLVTDENKPFMYTAGTISSNDMKNKESYVVPIVFEQKTAEVKFLLDLSDFGTNLDINTTNLFLYVPENRNSILVESKLYKGSINLIDGRYLDYFNAQLGPTNFKNRIEFESVDANKAYSKKYYTAKAGSVENFLINVNALEWGYPPAPDGQSQPKTSIKSDADRKVRYDFTNIKHGYSYTVKVKINDLKGVVINNLIWASNNLTYDHTTQVYGFKNDFAFPDGISRKRINTRDNMDDWAHGKSDQTVRPTYLPATNSKDYFKAGRLTSFTPTNTEAYVATNDPCSKHPDGGWRLPTEAEFIALYASAEFKKFGYFYDLIPSTLSNGIQGKHLKFYPYGSIEYVGAQELYNSNNKTYSFTGTVNYYPYELGYPADEKIMIRTYSNNYDTGEGRYLIQSESGFKYFKTGPTYHPDGTIQTGPKTIRNIQTSAFSVRCVKQITTTSR